MTSNLPLSWRRALAGLTLCLTVPLAMTALAAPAAAQPAAQPAASPRRVPDTIGQRVAACIACHGREGAATNAGYFPRLAGKPAGYLFNQLVAFRDGRRFQSDMAHLVSNLSDDYLREMADYFAALELPYPAPATRSDASDATLARGQALVFQGDPALGIPACAACHGQRLTGVAPAIPALVGLPRLYVASQLGAWVTGDRHALAPDCMASVGRKLASADINAVASWLALQPVPADPKPATALPGSMPEACGGVAAR